MKTRDHIDNSIPRHVAIIMDGNGRWAKEHRLSRTEGHRRGMRVVEEMVEAATENGVEVISFYAFSTENWKRPQSEVNVLMRFFYNFLQLKYKKLIKNNIKLRIMGDIESLSPKLKNKLKEVMHKTESNSRLIVNLGLNYGSRQEIIHAIKNMFSLISKKQFNLSSLDSDNFGQFLYTKGLPDPDLLIRTSGEMRLSNFMLWQLSYAELYFCKKYWPDFTKDDFRKAIHYFQNRERRFGDIYAQA